RSVSRLLSLIQIMSQVRVHASFGSKLLVDLGKKKRTPRRKKPCEKMRPTRARAARKVKKERHQEKSMESARKRSGPATDLAARFMCSKATCLTGSVAA